MDNQMLVVLCTGKKRLDELARLRKGRREEWGGDRK